MSDKSAWLSAKEDHGEWSLWQDAASHEVCFFNLYTVSFILFVHYVLICGNFFHLLRPDFWLLWTNFINICTTRLNYKSELFPCQLFFPTNKQTETFPMFSVAQNVFHWSDFLRKKCHFLHNRHFFAVRPRFSIQTVGQCLITLKNCGTFDGNGIWMLKWHLKMPNNMQGTFHSVYRWTLAFETEVVLKHRSFICILLLSDIFIQINI